MDRILINIWLLICSISIAYAGEETSVAIFSQQSLASWEAEIFSGETQYALFDLAGQSVLKAISDNAASGLVKEIRIDLQKTPYLNWTWYTENYLGEMDEQQKSGDDYVARVYVIISGGLLFWRTRAMSYVWSSNQDKGLSWPNAYAGDNARMLALRSHEDALVTWHTEKRNVYATKLPVPK